LGTSSFCSRSSSSSRRVLVRELARRLLVAARLLPLPEGADDRGQLRVPLGKRPGLIRVRVHAGIGEGTLKLGMLAG